MRKLTLVIGAVCLLSPISGLSQTPAPPTFDVSTVKLNNSGAGGSQTNFRNGTFLAVDVQLMDIMQHWAFGIPAPRILGGPKWMDSQRFDIEAKMDPAVVTHMQALPPEQGALQFRAMFQQLLADRFQLKTHWETRELPVYALVIANSKNGPTLTKAKDPIHTGGSSGIGQVQANSATLTSFAEALTQGAATELGRVVIDRTGIDGKYDIWLKWTPVTTESIPASGDAARPSIFTAIQEQLGLKLEPSKGPVKVLIIDSVAMPSAN